MTCRWKPKFVSTFRTLLLHMAGFDRLRWATTTLTDAQIKALPTTAITLVSAPGSGKSIVPLAGVLYTKTSSGAYTNINAAAEIQIRFSSTAEGLNYIANDAAITNGSATPVSVLLGGTTPRKAMLQPYIRTEDVDQWGPMSAIEASADSTNVALKIGINNQGSGNLTGGNAANSATVTVFYFIADVP